MNHECCFFKWLFAFSLISLTSTVFSQEAVIDAANLSYSVLNEAHLLVASTQLLEQTSQLALELKQLDPGNYNWSNAQNLINNLGSAVNQTNSLSYSAENIAEKFAQMNPGYVPAQDYSTQYKNNTATTMNTINGTLQSLSMSAQDFENENTRLAKLQTAAQTSTGQLQAIQSSAQIASEMVSQQQLLRQTLTAQANEQAVYHANQLQNEASAKAKLDSVINAGSTVMKGYGTSGDVINVHGK